MDSLSPIANRILLCWRLALRLIWGRSPGPRHLLVALSANTRETRKEKEIRIGRRNWNTGNEILQKIGRTTGWTYGAVEDTCEDYLINGIVRRCSDRVDYSSGAGDSGSPVFKLVNGFAHLRGIHFGHIGFPFNDGLMSNLGQVETDLGELVVCDPGPPVVTITGPTSVKAGLLCTWTASISVGIEPFTYSWSGLFSGRTESIEKLTVSSGWLNVSVTDWKSRTSETSVCITVDSNGPTPSGCTEWRYALA